MADFKKAVTYLLENEGGHYEDLATGEISNFGISLKWLETNDPGATADTVRSLTKAQAEFLYETYWWHEYRVDLLANDRIATKLFDAMVNMGPVTAIEMLQSVLNEPLDPHERLTVDGILGPATAKALAAEFKVNQVAEEEILGSFVEDLCTRYRKIARANIAHMKDLSGWLRRANRLP